MILICFNRIAKQSLMQEIRGVRGVSVDKEDFSREAAETLDEGFEFFLNAVAEQGAVACL